MEATIKSIINLNDTASTQDNWRDLHSSISGKDAVHGRSVLSLLDLIKCFRYGRCRSGLRSAPHVPMVQDGGARAEFSPAVTVRSSIPDGMSTSIGRPMEA